MSAIPHSARIVVPSPARGALLLGAIAEMKRLGLPHPSASEALTALGVGRSQAYALMPRLEERLGDLVASPVRAPEPPPRPITQEIATQVLNYVYEHAGAVSGSGRRRSYSQGFRLFVIEVAAAHPLLRREELARAIALPLPTLNDWLRGGLRELKPEQGEDDAPLTAAQGQIATVIDAWKRWEGGFVPFCDHVAADLHLPFRRTAIATILRRYGLRAPGQRPGRDPAESALRAAFATFFPNAQWVGDGTALSITINRTCYTRNLEMMVDPYSGAFIGANIRPTEDAAAVVAAFDDARATTGVAPLAVLLDNKPSNHTPEVVAAVAPATLMAATPYRPENKGHIEGGFGLLKSTIGKLNINAATPQELVDAILTLVLTVWARTINHRPRRARAGFSRAELLQDLPNERDIECASKHFSELHRQQKQARKTRAARQDPVVRDLIKHAIERFDLSDPTGTFLTAIAGFPLDAVVEAGAIFQAKKKCGSLPETADVRYLLGITKNVAQDREAWAIMEALWEARGRAKDLVVQRLEVQRESIASRHTRPENAIADYVDEAVASPWLMERFHWLNAVAKAIQETPPSDHQRQYLRAARRIQASYQLPNRERQVAIRTLAAKVRPLR